MNGRKAGAGTRVRAGQTIEVCLEEAAASCSGNRSDVCWTEGGTEAGAKISSVGWLGDSRDVFVVDSVVKSVALAEPSAGDARFLAFFKPAGLHTVSLAGGNDASLEKRLPELLPADMASSMSAQFPERHFITLVNRLDQPTSGMVLAGLDKMAVALWRQYEMAGKVEKRYLALVEGEMHGTIVLKNALDTNSRKKTRILAGETDDFLRHTLVTALARLETAAILPGLIASPNLLSTTSLPGELSGTENFPRMCTLVGCSIRRGARHQIRAHLASGGHPLLGDSLYGGHALLLQGFFLHHGFVRCPTFSATCLPEWPEILLSAGFSAEAVRDWLSGGNIH